MACLKLDSFTGTDCQVGNQLWIAVLTCSTWSAVSTTNDRHSAAA